MKTSAVGVPDLRASVIAVPPLARRRDLEADRAANAALIRHVEAGGVSTLLYGGNANFYNVGIHEYATILDILEESAASSTWVIPSVGPDFGKMMDQLPILRARRFPTVMVLPMAFPSSPDGIEFGISRFVEAFGRPVIVYLRSAATLQPSNLARLARSGHMCALKYSMPLNESGADDFLSHVLDVVDRAMVISGIGERPVVEHFRDYGLRSFTSGSVCLAPRGATQILKAGQRGDWARMQALRSDFLPLEELRDSLGPMCVLHEAVTLTEIADMGAILPHMSRLESKHHATVKAAACALMAADAALSEMAVH